MNSWNPPCEMFSTEQRAQAHQRARLRSLGEMQRTRLDPAVNRTRVLIREQGRGIGRYPLTLGCASLAPSFDERVRLSQNKQLVDFDSCDARCVAGQILSLHRGSGLPCEREAGLGLNLFRASEFEHALGRCKLSVLSGRKVCFTIRLRRNLVIKRGAIYPGSSQGVLKNS